MARIPFIDVLAKARSLFDPKSPLFQNISNILSRALSIDLTRLSVILTLFSIVSAVIIKPAGRSIHGLYEWAQKFLTVFVCVPGADELHQQVLNWVCDHVVRKQVHRALNARSMIPSRDEAVPRQYDSFRGRRKAEIDYHPSLKSTWFLYERRLFMITLSHSVRVGGKIRTLRRGIEGEGNGQLYGLTITSLGRSQEPIKRFLKECIRYSEGLQRSTVAVHGLTQYRYVGYGWQIKAYRPARQLDSVHLDEDAKAGLVLDIEQYLDPKTREYYASVNIPYRRGYLLHGPPGTGKTSLSMALAAEFGLDLYMLDLSAVPSDDVLDLLFQELPTPCVVLLEDVDVIGLKNRNEKDDEKESKRRPRPACTLSGLLNALDGVASSEGRILMITTNQPDELDEALVRPGRVDRKIYFGHVDQHVARQMFRRMFGGGSAENSTARGGSVESLGSVQDSFFTKETREYDPLTALATRFSKEIPEGTFTPAHLQEYLLRHRMSPLRAVDEVADWVVEEKRRMEEDAPKLQEVEDESDDVKSTKKPS
ncbi:P-loop containing nucleoside triphosphate hydrolase protein [Annulohypoxylon bovei var. microspora]|nr:P-loop containing nucleoside triphosphate hydrolase protein [Annulohypoxylon bovei var. microspora]